MIDEAQRFVESLEAYDGDSEFSRRWSGYTMTRASKKTPAGNELEFIEINRQVSPVTFFHTISGWGSMPT